MTAEYELRATCASHAERRCSCTAELLSGAAEGPPSASSTPEGKEQPLLAPEKGVEVGKMPEG
eukprot:14805964-Alexandrium_andersonii.AAC.1